MRAYRALRSETARTFINGLLVAAVSLGCVHTVHAATSPEIDEGLTWLKSQVKADYSVAAEDQSIAQVNQVRCEVKTTLALFNTYNAPQCSFASFDVAEILARANNLSEEFWLPNGGIRATSEFEVPSLIDTTWGTAIGYNVPVDQRLAKSIAYLFAQQTASGGFSLIGNIESVVWTALAGSALQSKAAQLTPDQRQKLALAAQWLQQRTSAPNYWTNAYQSALVHLFLVVADPSPSRDVSISEKLIAEQLPNGSWANDPFITAIVLRALSTRSVAVTTDSGYTLRVIDATTSQPMSGIYVNGYYTDTNGRVTVKQGPGNGINVTIQQSGYVSQTLTVNVVTGTIADLGDVRLAPAPTNLIVFGKVTDAITNQPIPYAYLYDAALGLYGSSDATGRFSVTGTTAGTLALQVSASGYDVKVASGSVALGQSYQVDFALVPAATGTDDAGVTGTVIDRASRAPIENALIQWQSSSGRYGYAYTDTAGAYTISSLKPESGTLSISASGYSGLSISGVVATKPSAQVNFELDAAPTTPIDGAVDGRVLDEVTSAPIAGVTIRLLNRNTNVEVRTAVTGTDGRFVLANVAFDYYKLVLEKPSYRSAEANVDLFSYSPRATVNGTMRRLISKVTGRVIDATTNQPISGASVTIGSATGNTDSSGNFEFAEIAAGTYSLNATASGYENGNKAILIQGLGPQAIGDVALQKVVSFAEIAGVITDAKTGLPIADASVKVSDTLFARTGAGGSYVIAGVPSGTQSVRTVADGYLPKTTSVTVTEVRRYKTDVALDKIADNTITVSTVTDKPQYAAYAPVEVSSTFVVPTGYSTTGQLDVALKNALGQIVAFARYASSPNYYDIPVYPNYPPYKTLLNTTNLPPGRYTIESKLYERSNFGAAPRAALAVSTTEIDIVETKVLQSVTTTALPTYANFRASESTASRIRIVNGSNVEITATFATALKNPSGSTVATSTLTIPIRPDERVRDLDLSSGNVLFDIAGTWPVTVLVSGVAAATPPAADKTIVLPGIRIDATKDINPKTITPDADRKIRIDLRIKGVEP
jgi:hypothetical protein